MELGDDYVLDLQSKMTSRWSSSKLLLSSVLTGPLSLFQNTGT